MQKEVSSNVKSNVIETSNIIKKGIDRKVVFGLIGAVVFTLVIWK